MGRIKIHIRERKIYRNWHNMVQRCKRNAVGYEHISVCSRWQKYDNFYDDMIGSYSDGMSIDRIDNSKGYSPENCRWATPKQQALNRRSNVYLELNGKRQTIQEWSEELNVKRSTIEMRLRRGLSDAQALTIGRITS